MAAMAAFVSAYAVSSARFACGKICIDCPSTSSPDMLGMRWSHNNKATLSPRVFSW
jgi:hypothetical protein